MEIERKFLVHKLPENLKTLDTKAFAGCTALEELFVPSTMEQLDENLFDVVT